MAENHTPSPEEIIEATKIYRLYQWETLITRMFWFDDEEALRGRDVRDRMWIMWNLARIAANEQHSDDYHKVVKKAYEKSKKEPKVAAEREPPQAPQRSRFSFSFHRYEPESGTE